MAAQVRNRQVPAAHRAALDAASGRKPQQAVQATNAGEAPLVVTLPPSAFQATWKGKPTEPARIGLRLVSETVNDKARANALASADRHYHAAGRDSDQYVEHYNGVLIRGVLAEAVCQPHDVTVSWFKAMPSEQIGITFHERGILRLWHGYCELREKLSPLLRLASAEDLTDLSTRLAQADAIGRLHDGDKRLLARILDDLRDQN